MDFDPPPSVQVKLLTLAFAPALGAFDDRPLDAFIADKDVLELREHFFSSAGLPYLACLVMFRGRFAPRPACAEARPRDSGPDALASSDLPLYQTLKTWRSTRARHDGVPPYVIFNNRELAGIARGRPRTRAGLLALDGVGAGKVERYGDDLLRLLAPPPPGAPVVPPAQVATVPATPGPGTES